MVELKLGLRSVDLPYTVRIPNVTEEMFDQLVDENTKAELLDGVMVVHSPASPRHDVVSGFLRTMMWCYAEAGDLGQVFGPDAMIHLATCRKFAPDAFFLTQGRIPRPLPKQEFDGAPDLVLEVLSPSNRDEDLQDKWPAYRDARIREIWLVNPDEHEVIVDRLRGASYITKTITRGRVDSKVLKGFWMDAEWLWSDPLPKVARRLRKIVK